MIDNKMLLRKLAVLAIPIALQGVISASLNLVDNLMVGALGEAELAAVGIAVQVYMIHYTFLFGITSGTSTFIAQFYGKGDFRNIRKSVGFAITVATGVSLCFLVGTLLFADQILDIYTSDKALAAISRPYLLIGTATFLLVGVQAPLELAFKAIQQPRIPLMVGFIVSISNTLLNYMLIFGHLGVPAMGVAGAATATVIARSMGCGMILFFTFRRGSSLRGPIGDFFGWSPELIRRIVKNAVPTTLNEVFWSLGSSMYVAAFSRMGTTSYAAYQAAEAIRQIFSFASFSVGDAALILIGEKLGEGNKKEAYVLAKKLLVVGIIVGLVFGAGIIAAAWPLVHMFALSEQGRLYAFRILLVLGSTLFIFLFSGICTTGILRGGGDTRFAARTEILCIWLIGVPIAFASSLWWHLPIYLAVLLMRLTELTESVIYIFRIRSKKWMNTVVHDL
jgi:putative MATE family efflux protein